MVFIERRARFITESWENRLCQCGTLGEDVKNTAKLAGLILCTNRYAPAPNFYRKNGFVDNEFIMFIYKEF